MFRLWSEWDIGENNLIFASKEAGTKWLRNNAAVLEMADDENMQIDAYITQLFCEGFFSWQAVEFVQ
jgi:hypothetical protein